MTDYNGQEMVIRTTNNGKFQVLPVAHTPADMSRAPVFATRPEAEAYISRPMPRWVADENAKQVERQKYNLTYSAILARPEFREMRGNIQDLYGESKWQAKLAADAQRAVAYSIGKISVMGRDIGAARQGTADYQASEADAAEQAWADASRSYETAVQQAMTDADIPVALFRF